MDKEYDDNQVEAEVWVSDSKGRYKVVLIDDPDRWVDTVRCRSGRLADYGTVHDPDESTIYS